MYELKMILEEIDAHAIEFETFGVSDDYISVGWVKEIIRKHMNDNNPCGECSRRKWYQIGYKDGMKNSWISAEERLPDEGEPVLVWYEYLRYGDYNCMFQTYGIGYQYNGRWFGDVNGTKAKCIAWKPLPEPYRPERRKHDR